MPALAAIALACLSAPPAFAADNLTGSMQWASGILSSSITVTGSGQVVSVTSGSTTTNYGSVLVVAPVGTTINGGSLNNRPVVILKAGSQPVVKNFPSLSLTADGGTMNFSRQIPVDSTGKTINAVAFFSTVGDPDGHILTPAFNTTTYTWANGLDLKFANYRLPIAYTLTVDNVSLSTSGSFTFPALEGRHAMVSITGLGLECNAQGRGANTSLTFAGRFITPNNVFPVNSFTTARVETSSDQL